MQHAQSPPKQTEEHSSSPSSSTSLIPTSQFSCLLACTNVSPFFFNPLANHLSLSQLVYVASYHGLSLCAQQQKQRPRAHPGLLLITHAALLAHASSNSSHPTISAIKAKERAEKQVGNSTRERGEKENSLFLWAKKKGGTSVRRSKGRFRFFLAFTGALTR